MIPDQILNLTEDRIREITNYLCDEIQNAKDERQGMEDYWSKWKIIYEAKPKRKRKNFPWINASNMVFPLAAIHSENLFARLYGTIMRAKPIFSARPLSSDWIRNCRPVEDFLDYTSVKELRLPPIGMEWIFEAVKMGTGIVKLVWEQIPQKKYFKDNKGRTVFRIIEKSAPVLYFCPIQSIIVPSDSYDIQNSRWIDHVTYKSPMSLRHLEEADIYRNVDKVISWLGKPDDITEEQMEREGINVNTYQGIHVHEVWANIDIDNDGLPEGVVFTIHKDSRTCLRAAPNGFHHQDYPFHRIRFFPQENRFYGIGICAMSEQLQEGITTALNQWIDNATAANTRVWKAKKNAGIKINERIYPSKVLFMENPREDLMGEQLGDVYGSGVLLVNLLKSIAEQRTGVTDYYQGRESQIAGSRATATSTLALIRQSNLKTDLTLTDIGIGLSGLATQQLQLYQQYYPEGRSYFVMGPQAEYVEQVFSIPQDYIPEKIAIELTASSVSVNREIERQFMLQLIPVVNNYYGQLVYGLTQAKSPQAPPGIQEFIGKMAKGGSELMSRLVELFVKDPETFIPSMEEIDQYLSANKIGGAENVAGGQGFIGEAPREPGMEGLP